MKVFRVIAERDGKTKKAPGEITTEILREERFYAAERITDVFIELSREGCFQEEQVGAVIEICPALTILKASHD
jgi:hypothetical protein